MLKSVKVYDGNPVEYQFRIMNALLLEFKWKAFIGHVVKMRFSSKRISGPHP